MNIWKRKLLAFLHDPPAKALDIAGHTQMRSTFINQSGLVGENLDDFDKICDHTAAAADRFPFPVHQKMKSDFTGGVDSPFKHPLGGTELVFEEKLSSSIISDEIFQTMQKGIKIDDLPEAKRDWANFFLHWRRWPIESARHDWRTYYLPADTRIPDHNIWCHNSVVSALQGCVDEKGALRAAFLLFQLGPVQEFIAQARSARDLWSGSYLISWLIANAMKVITDEIGPDSVIFPSLRGQPVFDLLHKENLLDLIRYDNDTLWKRLEITSNEYLTPSLPNRFLAVVPQNLALNLAKSAEKTVHVELKKIGNKCWEWLDKYAPMHKEWRKRFDKQIELFPQVTWQIYSFCDDIQSCLQNYTHMYSTKNEYAENLKELYDLATRQIPEGDRDKRYFVDENVSSALNNAGFCWPYFYAKTELLLSGRRNLRDFVQWETDEHQKGTVKDFYSGKEEVIGSEEWWKSLKENKNEIVKSLFRKDDRLGAINLVKRVWHKAYLVETLGLRDDAIRFESVPEVAAGKELSDKEQDEYSGYFAVLALDGDEMGKWVSGSKMPPFYEQLSKEAKEYFSSINQQFCEIKRPLFPSWHLQFSEMLTNFATKIARPIVKHYKGELIYAGGDDVLAMLPAKNALECAQELRNAFRGQDVKGLFVKKGTNGGFLISRESLEKKKKDMVFMMPGPATDVSVGIAMAHCSSPLQGVVDAARKAERLAKNNGKSSVGIALYKRSGEIIEWCDKWNSKLLSFLGEYLQVGDDMFSNRFPYALAELLEPYFNKERKKKDNQSYGKDPKESGFDWTRVTELEFMRVVKRQMLPNAKEKVNSFSEKVLDWIREKVRSESDVRRFLGVFMICAFMLRKEKGENKK